MNPKKIFSFVLLLTVLLVSCSQQATPPTATPSPIPVKPTQLVQNSSPSSPPASCRVAKDIELPEVSENDWVVGPQDAEQTFIVYSDFQCPYCAMMEPLLAKYQKENADSVRYVFRHFPLPSHPKSLIATQIAEAAGLQGKFFEMTALLMEKQQEWSGLSDQDFEQWILEQAKTLKLDIEKFTQDFKSEAMVQKAKDAQSTAMALGIGYTPFIVVNGKIYQGALDKKVINSFLAFTQRQYKACPPQIVDPAKKYTATLKTEKGDIVIQLYPDKAPVTVNSFVFLAREHWFDGITFHRVIPGFVAQTGDPLADGTGSPGYEYGNEISDLQYDQPGRVGMANAGPDTNGCQFFITYDALPQLNGGYTIFGQVINGMDVLKNLKERIPDNGGDLPPGDKILSVTIEEKL